MLYPPWREENRIVDRVMMAEAAREETKDAINSVFGTVGGPLKIGLDEIVLSLDWLLKELRGLL